MRSGRKEGGVKDASSSSSAHFHYTPAYYLSFFYFCGFFFCCTKWFRGKKSAVRVRSSFRYIRRKKKKKHSHRQMFFFCSNQLSNNPLVTPTNHSKPTNTRDKLLALHIVFLSIVQVLKHSLILKISQNRKFPNLIVYAEIPPFCSLLIGWGSKLLVRFIYGFHFISANLLYG